MSNNKENCIGTKLFGVYIPSEDQAKSNDKSCVVRSLKELQDVLKRNPHARFKPADTEEEALFLTEDSDSKPLVTEETQETTAKVNSSPRKNGRKGRLSLSALDSLMTSSAKEKMKEQPKKPSGEEKDTRFSSPKIQELTAMARDITAKRNTEVFSRVGANPRVLVTDCDVPTTVQEGCRYNALHVAAKCDNREVIAFILNTVSSYEYMKLLYPKDSDDIITDRIRHVVNGYLNTPDKMANETPLHFASKFLCSEAVEVLTSHPLCNFDVVNIYKEAPIDIVGSRGDAKATGFASKKEKIAKLLEHRYVVPIWRDPMGVLQPVVGEIATLKDLGSQLSCHIFEYFPDLYIPALGPCNTRLLPRQRYNKGQSGVFDEEVRWEVKAFAGPTTKEKAHELFSGLKLTCGRGYQTSSSPVPPPLLYDRNHVPVFPMPEGWLKGNRSINHQDSPSPPRTPTKHENVTPPLSPFQYSPMVQRYLSVGSPVSPGPRDIMIRRQDPEKGLERIARKFSAQLNIPWCESWSFLNYFGEISSARGLRQLEKYLKNVETAQQLKNSEIAQRITAATNVCLTTPSKGQQQRSGEVRSDGKTMGRFLDNSISDRLDVSRPGGSLEEIVNRMNDIRLNDSGYPTPRRIPDCYNSDCKKPGRFCTCKGVAPSLYFQVDTSPSQGSDKGSLNSDFSGYMSEGFEVNDSGDSIFPQPVSIGMNKTSLDPITLGITRLDEERRDVKLINSSESSLEGGGLQNLSILSSAGSGIGNASYDSDGEEWMSAESSPDTSMEYEECDGEPIFLNGNKPSKQDFQIFAVLKESEDAVSCELYPLAFQWLNTMKTLVTSCEKDTRLKMRDDNSVPTSRNRGIRLRDLPNFSSTPKRLHMSLND